MQVLNLKLLKVFQIYKSIGLRAEFLNIVCSNKKKQTKQTWKDFKKLPEKKLILKNNLLFIMIRTIQKNVDKLRLRNEDLEMDFRKVNSFSINYLDDKTKDLNKNESFPWELQIELYTCKIYSSYSCSRSEKLPLATCVYSCLYSCVYTCL